MRLVFSKSFWCLLVPIIGYLSALPCTARAYAIKASKEGHEIRWDGAPIVLRFDAELEAFLDHKQASSALSMAVEAWRGYPRVPEVIIESGAELRPGYHEGIASNGAYLIEDWEFEPSKLAVTITTFRQSTGELLDADILVNGRGVFSFPDDNARIADDPHYDIGAVITHEIGHLLGLGDSADDEAATMWGYIVPGDTKQRSLEDDDENGVIDLYSGMVPPLPASCGPSSVAGGSAGSSLLLRDALFLLALLIAVRLRPSFLPGPRARALALRGAFCCLVSLCLFCSSYDPAVDSSQGELRARKLVAALAELPPARALPALNAAALDGSITVRAAAARFALEHPVRDLVGVTSRLSTDADREVAALGLQALELALQAPPTAGVCSHVKDARKRLAEFMGEETVAHRGIARRLDAYMMGGIIYTEFEVQTEEGDRIPFRVMGGTVGDLSQHAGHEVPPADGSRLVVVPRADGLVAWARVKGDDLYGGWLVDGPAIRGAAARVVNAALEPAPDHSPTPVSVGLHEGGTLGK